MEENEYKETEHNEFEEDEIVEREKESCLNSMKCMHCKYVIRSGDTLPSSNNKHSCPRCGNVLFNDGILVKHPHNTDGGKTDFYNIVECKDLDDLAEHLELLSDEFNVMKAIFGIAKERKDGAARHSGTNTARDSKKLKHYSKRIIARLQS